MMSDTVQGPLNSSLCTCYLCGDVLQHSYIASHISELHKETGIILEKCYKIDDIRATVRLSSLMEELKFREGYISLSSLLSYFVRRDKVVIIDVELPLENESIFNNVCKTEAFMGEETLYMPDTSTKGENLYMAGIPIKKENPNMTNTSIIEENFYMIDTCTKDIFPPVIEKFQRNESLLNTGESCFVRNKLNNFPKESAGKHPQADYHLTVPDDVYETVKQELQMSEDLDMQCDESANKIIIKEEFLDYDESQELPSLPCNQNQQILNAPEKAAAEYVNEINVSGLFVMSSESATKRVLRSTLPKRLLPIQEFQLAVENSEVIFGSKFKVANCYPKGKGLLSKIFIRKGEFLMYYDGEYNECKKNFLNEDYVYEIKSGRKIICINAEKSDGVAKYMNDSLNCANVKPKIHKYLNKLYVAFYAKVDIHPDEELLYTYATKSDDSKHYWWRKQSTHSEVQFQTSEMSPSTIGSILLSPSKGITEKHLKQPSLEIVNCQSTHSEAQFQIPEISHSTIGSILLSPSKGITEECFEQSSQEVVNCLPVTTAQDQNSEQLQQLCMTYSSDEKKYFKTLNYKDRQKLKTKMKVKLRKKNLQKKIRLLKQSTHSEVQFQTSEMSPSTIGSILLSPSKGITEKHLKQPSLEIVNCQSTHSEVQFQTSEMSPSTIGSILLSPSKGITEERFEQSSQEVVNCLPVTTAQDQNSEQLQQLCMTYSSDEKKNFKTLNYKDRQKLKTKMKVKLKRKNLQKKIRLLKQDCETNYQDSGEYSERAAVDMTQSNCTGLFMDISPGNKELLICHENELQKHEGPNHLFDIDVMQDADQNNYSLASLPLSVEEGNYATHINRKSLPQATKGIKRVRTAVKRPCVYCSVMQTKLTRHLIIVHKDEDDVSYALTLCDKKARAAAFNQLRKKGIHKLNVQLIKDGKKPGHSERKGHQNLVMCGRCQGFYGKKTFLRHSRRCAPLIGGKETPCALTTTSINVPREFNKTIK